MRTLCVLCLALLVGCASTPEGRWYQSRDSLTAAEKLVIIAVDAGKIDDDTLVTTVKPLVKGAQGALADAQEELPEGGTVFEALMKAFDRYIAELEVTYDGN